MRSHNPLQGVLRFGPDVVASGWTGTRKALTVLPASILRSHSPTLIRRHLSAQPSIDAGLIDVAVDGVQSTVTFKNFPLNFHADAQLAAQAAQAAAERRKLWEMHDLLFAHQSALKRDDLLGYAGKLGMDETNFAAMLEERKYIPRVEVDLPDGMDRGVRGGPVVFVNGKRMDGVPSLQMLTEYVEAALASKK